MARSRAIRVLSYALPHNAANCSTFVEMLGLKVCVCVLVFRRCDVQSLFSSLMIRSYQGPKSSTSSAERESLFLAEQEHLLSILTALLSLCTGVTLARVTAKFVEKEFEKTDRLVDLHIPQEAPDVRLEYRGSVGGKQVRQSGTLDRSYNGVCIAGCVLIRRIHEVELYEVG